MASSGKVDKRRLAAARNSTVTANQLGYAVESLVMYKDVPYHVCAVSLDGTKLVLKRCDNANKMRDVEVTHKKLSLISSDHPAFEKWALTLKFHPFERTRMQELVVLKVLIERCEGKSKQERRDLIVDLMSRNMWLGVWFRACYDLRRDYRITKKHVYHEKVRPFMEKHPPEQMSLFPALAKLQGPNKLKPIELAALWRKMLQPFPKEQRKILNMFLEHKFGDITLNDVRYAMKKTNNLPLIPKPEEIE